MSRTGVIKVTYTNNRGNSICLTDYPYYMNVEPLFDYKWSYTSKDKGNGSAVKGFYKEIAEKTLNLVIMGSTKDERDKAIDALNSIIEADIYDGAIGTLKVGNWYCYGYITSAENTSWQYGSAVIKKEVTFVSERQAWYRVLKKNSYGNEIKVEASEFDKQYEPCYPYPYDYTNEAASQLILVNPAVNPSEFKLSIQGPAESPYLKIGDNVYHITADVPDGAYLVIDSTKKTAIMTLADGTIVNMFGTRDSGFYIFKRIESGRNAVVYDGTFLWQLEVLEERSEPRWHTE